MKKMIVVIASMLIAACGGGGGGGSGSPTSSTPTVTDSSSSASSIAPSSVAVSSSSEQSSSSATIQINPLAAGSGTFSTQFVIGGTYKINETDGAIEKLSNPLEDYYFAADTDSQGYVIACSTTLPQIDRVDFESGKSEKLFSTPEILSAIAVAPDGVIVGVSKDSEFSKKRIYRFSASGELLSSTPSEHVNPNGIDFDQSGTMYGIDLTGTWKINPVTGTATMVHLFSPSGQSDIDISPENEIRTINFGKLDIYSLTTGQSIKSVVLQHDYFSFSPLVRR